MGKQEFTIPRLAERLRTEADAYLLLEELRWGGTPDACPHCGEIGRCSYIRPLNGTSRATRTGTQSQRRVWKCYGCRKQFSVLTGTIFHGSKIPVRTWLLVIFQMCASKNGLAAREIQRSHGLTAKTAWFMLHRIREAMKREPLAGLLTGTVIADETFIGGDPRNRHRNDPRELNRTPGTSDKIPVFTLVHHETREARSRVVADVTGASLMGAIQEQVQDDRTHLWTDSAQAYVSAADVFVRHDTVNHVQGQYVSRGGVTTNAVEGFFSQLKRSIDGTHHHVSVAHLPRYLANFDFMYTHCRETDSRRMRILLGRVGGRRLMYKPVAGA